MTDLLDAVKHNDISRVHELLAQGADVNVNLQTDAGETPLWIAVKQPRPNYEMVYWLVELYHANPNIKLLNGLSLLDLVISKHTEASQHFFLNETANDLRHIMQLLLENGADPNWPPNTNQYSMLQRVIRSSNIDMIDILLEYKADVNFSLPGRLSVFWDTLISDKYRTNHILRLLLRHYAKIDTTKITDKELVVSLLHVHCVHKKQAIPADFVDRNSPTRFINDRAVKTIDRYRLFLNQDREHTRNLQSWMKQRLIYYYLLFSIKQMTAAKILDELVSVHSYTEAGAKAAWDYITSKYPPMSLTMITHLQRLPDDLLHTLSATMTKDNEYSFDDFPGMHPCCATLRERFDTFTPV